MLQWMGGARRKMKATKDSKLKRQREFFDHRKEKKRRNELGAESGKLQTLADYIRQNLHGGESLDILGLRSLNPTPADVNTAANSDANLPDPAIASLKPRSGGAGGATVATSNVSASSVGALKEDNHDTSPHQPECKIKSRRIIQGQKQERDAYAQRKPEVADAAQQENKKHVSRNTELPLPGKGRNPVHVGNLQTKKVASAPRLNFSDMIISDVKGDSRGKKRSVSEAYAVFSQDGIDDIDNNMFDQHPQQTLITSDSVADWVDTKQLLPPSLQPNNTSGFHLETQANTGTSDLLSRFLSAQKLKSFNETSSHQHGRQPQGRNTSGKDSFLESQSLLNSFRVTHNERHSLGFSNPTFNITNGQVKEESRGINFPTAMFDMENFHVKQELEEFDISDPFVTIASHHVKQEHEGPGFPDPFTITKDHQAKRESQEYGFLNPSFNTGDHQVTQGYPFLPDLSDDRDTFTVDRNFFERVKGSSSPGSDLVNWGSDSQLDTSSTPSYLKSGFKREFPALDEFRSGQVERCDGSANNGFYQFGTSDNIPDMTEKFFPLGNRETVDVKFDKLRLPLDGFEFKGQHSAAAFSSLDDYSPTRMMANRSNFENEPPDWDDVLREKCTFSDQWNCKPSSEARDSPRRQENNDPAHSGGNSRKTRNHDDCDSWSQTVAGGTAEHSSNYLSGDMEVIHDTSPRHDVMQGKDLSSETQVTTSPAILQDSNPPFFPQINNGNEDFIIVCFSDNEDSPKVDANTIHLPVQSIDIPLQLFRTVEASSKREHNINVLSPETLLNRSSQEIDDSRAFGIVVTAAKATTTTDNKLILGREDLACDRILSSGQQSQKEYLRLRNSVSSLKKDTEILSWQVKEPQREAYSELQSLKARSPSPNLLAIEGAEFEDGLEHHSSNSDKADQCFSSNVLYSHCDDHAVQHEMMHNIEKNCLEDCTHLKEVLEANMNGMSTTKAKGTLQKQLRAGNAHDYGCQASFSSQEECSPAFQLNTVQAVLCKLQRPVCSCGSKQGTFSEHGIKNVETVLLKPQRSPRPSGHGLGHQDIEGNQTLEKDTELTSDMNQKGDLELESEPTAEREARSLTHLNVSSSRGSLPLSNADKCCMERSAPKPISRSSKENAEKRGLSDISKQRNREVRLSLDDIDAIASSSHRVSIQPYRRANGSKAHSLRSDVEIKRVPITSLPVGDSIQNPTSASPRNPILVVPEEEQVLRRISDPPAGDAKDYFTPVSQRNLVSIVPDKAQLHLTESELPASQTGALEIRSNTPQVSERQKAIQASQDQQDLLNDTLCNLPSIENSEKDGGSTTSYDAAYVKMLESYVVQLKLENNVLRLSNGS
ncbi:hypothetical protein M758_8G017200 [Ceratodon purpureus]|nr:hypothetical protein M758_8G017200 [Ceratodon purpureus]